MSPTSSQVKRGLAIGIDIVGIRPDLQKCFNYLIIPFFCRVVQRSGCIMLRVARAESKSGLAKQREEKAEVTI